MWFVSPALLGIDMDRLMTKALTFRLEICSSLTKSSPLPRGRVGICRASFLLTVCLRTVWLSKTGRTWWKPAWSTQRWWTVTANMVIVMMVDTTRWQPIRSLTASRSESGLCMWRGSPAGGQGDPQKGLVAQQLSVQLHEVLLLPLHYPAEVPMSQLDLKHRREHLGEGASTRWGQC